MKIVNKKKFLKSISIVCFILIMMVMFSNKTYSNANKKYKEEYIYNGDTLWEIAIKEREENSYFKGKDIRTIVYEIKNINILDNADVYNGQKILIPTF